jgi:glycosyltransferase involved in cell wall biosynthesis
MPGVSVIVPARNAAATLPATLAALAALAPDAPEHEVIVVDDGSTDATAQLAQAAGVRVVRTGGGAGPGGARNAGVRAAGGTALAFTDADCAPRPGWLGAGVAALRDAELVQGRVVPDPHAARGPFDRTVSVEAERGLYETANLFVDRALFERLGGFEDWLALGGRGARPSIGEDVLFAWSARRAGARTVFCAGAVVEHAVFPGTLRTHLRERARLRHLPALVRRVPELRDAACHRRLFLSPRSAAMTGLAAGAVVALTLRRPALAALAAAPYVHLVARRAAPSGLRRGTRLAALTVLEDAVGAGALWWGSARHRTPLL